MYHRGHVGAALLVYAPLGAYLSATGVPRLAAVGAGVAVALSTLPDVDEVLPIAHRGITHTVWFVAAVVLVAAAAGAVLGSPLGSPATVAVVVATTAGLSLLSHLLADSITPMGIAPFAPLSRWHVTLDVTASRNPRANTTLFGAGLLAVVGCQTVVLL